MGEIVSILQDVYGKQVKQCRTAVSTVIGTLCLIYISRIIIISLFCKFFLELEPMFVNISILEIISSMYLSFKKY